MRKTNLERYGVEYPLQNETIRKKVIKTKGYKIDNIFLDSSWELIYYFYNKYILGNNIHRAEDGIEYYDSFGKCHYYFPDFIINDNIYEIKGDHLLKRENGKIVGFKFPYKLKTKKQSLKKEDIMFHKFKTAQRLNVSFITKKDIDFLEKEIVKNIGKSQWNFLKNSFKIIKNNK